MGVFNFVNVLFSSCVMGMKVSLYYFNTFCMPEILHVSSLIAWSEWTVTFFDLAKVANSSSLKKLPYCQHRILPSLLLYLHIPFRGKWRDVKSSPQHPSFRSRAWHLSLCFRGVVSASDYHTPNVVPLLGQESACSSLTAPFFLNDLETWFRYLRNPCYLDSSSKD